ncbi:hypothetical protein ACL02O_32580 [Micromonospora sp. MS34]
MAIGADVGTAELGRQPIKQGIQRMGRDGFPAELFTFRPLPY